MPIRSIESSSAPSRRTSCSRWPSASAGRNSNSIVVGAVRLLDALLGRGLRRAAGLVEDEPGERLVPEPPSSLAACRQSPARAAQDRQREHGRSIRAATQLSPLPLIRPLSQPDARASAPRDDGFKPARVTTSPRRAGSIRPVAEPGRSRAAPRRRAGGGAGRSPRLTAIAWSPRRKASTLRAGVEQLAARPSSSRAQRDQLAVEVEHRVRVARAGRRRCGRSGSVGGSHGSPSLKPPRGGRVPLHRVAIARRGRSGRRGGSASAPSAIPISSPW